MSFWIDGFVYRRRNEAGNSQKNFEKALSGVQTPKGDSTMRGSTALGLILLFLLLFGCLEGYDYQQRIETHREAVRLRAKLQRVVGLTDLSITTAARYLRHYTLGNLATPFQDFPASLDHFPAGFAYAPPDFSNTPKTIVFGRMPSPPVDRDGEVR